MMCSHIILRLRSCFSAGDAIVDGDRHANDLYSGGGFGNVWTTTHGMVSTEIRFAPGPFRANGVPDGDDDVGLETLRWDGRNVDDLFRDEDMYLGRGMGMGRDAEAALESPTVVGSSGDETSMPIASGSGSGSGSGFSGEDEIVELDPKLDWTNAPEPAPLRRRRIDPRRGSKGGGFTTARSSIVSITPTRDYDQAVTAGGTPQPPIIWVSPPQPPGGRASSLDLRAAARRLAGVSLALTLPIRRSFQHDADADADGDISNVWSEATQLEEMGGGLDREALSRRASRSE